MSKDQRAAIIQLFKTKTSVGAIAKTLKVPRQKVYRAIKRYKELGTTADRPRSGKPITATTPENVNRVKCRLYRNSEQSMRTMAKSMRISEQSVRRIVRNKLHRRSYKMSTAHYLNDRMKLVRLEKARRLLEIGPFWSILFTDEKVFNINRPINRQNNRQICRNRTGMSQIFFSF